jgi:hypothetical protein
MQRPNLIVRGAGLSSRGVGVMQRISFFKDEKREK